MRFFRMAATLAALLALGFAPRQPLAAAMNPIQVKQCFVTVPKAFSKLASGTQIVYVVRGRKAATKVIFVVGYRNAASHFLRRAHDEGDFAPGVTINHHFDLYNDVTYGGKQTHGCAAVAVTFSDGSHWAI